MYRVYTGIYQVYVGTSWTYTGIYLFFASRCLNSDFSISDHRISCNVHDMCSHADSIIRNFPKGMKNRLKIQWVYDGIYQAVTGIYMHMTSIYRVQAKLCFCYFDSTITCSLHVLCMLAYSNIRKISPGKKTYVGMQSLVICRTDEQQRVARI